MAARGRPRRLTYAASTQRMRRLFAAGLEAERRGMPLDEVVGEADERVAVARITRREFLARGTATAGAIAVGGMWRPSRAGAARVPRIAIVGAGLAGLRCAHDLWTGHGARFASTVYEADTTHIGGRCWSLREFFSDGLIGEHGGSFINTDQRAIRRLVSSLGLQLEDVNGGDLLTGDEVYWFDGAPYTYDEAKADWLAIGRAVFKAAQEEAPWPQTYDRHTRQGRRLDHLSVPEWLEHVGIGTSTRFGRLLLADAVSEYGGDPYDQSSINLSALMDPGDRELDLADYDEKYHVVGGNDQIVSRMVGALPPGTVVQGHALVALAVRGNGSLVLTFAVDGATRDVVADLVVLALPFSTLRDVDLTAADLSPRKLHAIRTMGMGQNAKVHVELRRKTWPALGYSGSSYTDWDGYCVAWDDSVPRGAHGHPAILLGFPGGATGRDTLTGVGHGVAPPNDVRWFLDQIEPLVPGTTAEYSGVAYEDHWSADPWHKGAYSYYRVGQYTSFGGSEHLPEGTIHFAGEHTDLNQQGFLDGAVASGERAAGEIRRALAR